MKKMRNLYSFTVIELLVTVAIIAIIAALLMPALLKAREQGQRISCMNGLRNIGNAMIMYAQEWGGFFPPTKNIGDDDVRVLFPGYIDSLEPFVCPGTHNYVLSVDDLITTAPDSMSQGMSYEYQAWIDEASTMRLTLRCHNLSDEVIVADSDNSGVNLQLDPTDNHGTWGGNMLYGDGHVIWIRGGDWYNW